MRGRSDQGYGRGDCGVEDSALQSEHCGGCVEDSDLQSEHCGGWRTELFRVSTAGVEDSALQNEHHRVEDSAPWGWRP